MEFHPSADELLEAVGDFLRTESGAGGDERRSFHARVAANAVEIARREMALRITAEEREHARLRAVLRHDGGLGELNRELCRRIRAGDASLSETELRAHLWATTLDAAAIDQPRYSGYRAALAKRNAG
jgi:hypothetical protein